MQRPFLSSHGGLISLTAFQTLSVAFWKSKPTLSTRPLLPVCMWTPSKNSSRLVEHVGSSPKQLNFFMCQLILLGQMLGSVVYSTLDPIKKTLPSFGEQSWLQTTARSSPWVHPEALGEHQLGLGICSCSFSGLGSPPGTWTSAGYSGKRKQSAGSSLLNPGVKVHRAFLHTALFLSVCSLESTSLWRPYSPWSGSLLLLWLRRIYYLSSRLLKL